MCAGQEKALEVLEPEPAEGEEVEEEEETREGGADQAAGAEEEQPLAAADDSQELPESCKPKMKLFTGKSAAGLRIRSEPSFVVRVQPVPHFTYCCATHDMAVSSF